MSWVRFRHPAPAPARWVGIERIGYALGVITSSSVFDRTGGSASIGIGNAVGDDHPSGTFTWIDVTDPVAADFDRIAADLQLHELAAEDAVEAGQRPKVERYDDTLVAVFRPARLDDAGVIVYDELRRHRRPVRADRRPRASGSRVARSQATHVRRGDRESPRHRVATRSPTWSSTTTSICCA